MPEAPVPVLIKEAQKKIRAVFDARFAKEDLKDLRPAEGQVLCHIACHPGCTSAEIQEARRLCKASVSESLSILAERGYIEYASSPVDRREKTIQITEKGLSYHRAASDAVQECHNLILSGINEEEQQALRELLNRIIENSRKEEA